MTVPSIKSARVEGTIVDGQGQPVTGVMLEVLSTVGDANSMSAVTPRPDGSFVFASLAPGDYVFRTQATPSRSDVALLKLTLAAGDDIKDLRLVTMPPATLSGRVVIDPSMPPPAASFSVMASLDNAMMPGGMRPAKIADDLSFELTASPGRNHIVTLNMPAGWMMRAVRVDSVDVIDDGIEVAPGQRITGVDIELTSRGGSVSGLVTNDAGEPARDYSVVLFPADAKRWKAGSRYLRMARPDRDGRFRLSSLAAADYYIVAVDKLEPGEGNDAAFLERMAPGSKRLSIVEGDVKTVDLKVTAVR
jgi:hypothetical protein